MLKLLGGPRPVELGSPMVVTGVACRGDVLVVRLKPAGADLHPSGDGWHEPIMVVRCRLDVDHSRELACLELWRVSQLVVRVALEPEQERVSLWRPRGWRVELTMARSAR